MKLIIAITGPQNTGKTSTLAGVSKLLLDWTKYDKMEVLLNGEALNLKTNQTVTREIIKEREDFSLFMNIANWKIGVGTAGDDIWTTKENHTYLIKEKKCDIVILGIRRSKHAGSWKETNKVADEENYSIIETQTFSIAGKEKQNLYNDIKARRIFEIIKSLMEVNDLYF